jgi:hypothetical protein
MALHPQFPNSPYEPLVPDQRGFAHLRECQVKECQELIPGSLAAAGSGLVTKKRLEEHELLATIDFTADFLERQS